ncbi:MAG: outer membrane beta-barrel protein [Pyrinomonadaceae bacterium]|nr:outer membrane beta-barrel protein [Pyrinomonadaceae bacterium]
MKLAIKNLISRLPFCAVLLMCSTAFALAQSANQDDYPKVEVFVGYSGLFEANSRGIAFGPGRSVGGNYHGDGFETSVIGNFNRNFGIKGDFSAHLKTDNERGELINCTPTCTTATQDFQLKTRLYNFLVGPEFKARNSTRVTPFVYALGGVAHTSATFTTPGPTFNLLLKKSDTSFAMALGGGLDIRATKRLSFRGSMDYNPVFVKDSTSGTRDLVRISFGVLIH